MAGAGEAAAGGEQEAEGGLGQAQGGPGGRHPAGGSQLAQVTEWNTAGVQLR